MNASRYAFVYLGLGIFFLLGALPYERHHTNRYFGMAYPLLFLLVVPTAIPTLVHIGITIQMLVQAV